MMVEDLPVGNLKAPVEYPHFASRWQAFLWRNWELVPPGRLAAILQCTEAEIFQAAEEMGLTAHPQVNPKWLSHGYLTLIRNNWQLLPYSQILQLLDWIPEKMAYTLKEEDFFWTKLGKIKPDCLPLKYEELTPAQHEATKHLRTVLRKYFPEEQMEYLESPFAFADQFAPLPPTPGGDRFDFNYIHSYAASCGDVLGNAETLDPVPENLLSQYASMGIKGVWMHALLYLLNPIPGAEEYSAGHEKRMANLKRIVNSCAKYGIKVYLYLNEPRCMPLDFYEKKPLWGGIEVPAVHTRTICTTRSPEPLQWLEDTMKKLFSEASGLGGVFCITMSENPTNCHFQAKHENCPSCKNVLPEKIIADVITAMEKGMHAADPGAKMIAFDWAWRRDVSDPDNTEFKCQVLDLLPRSVYVCSVSEWGMNTNIGGIKQYLVDYSISQVGPSPETLGTWEHARKIGTPIVAKVQINNSWELSAVPYIPVPYLIEEHLNHLKKAGVSGLMLSWTLGGFPGGNLDLLKTSPEEIAASKYHPELAQKVCRAWKQFSEAFRQFPFNVSVLYTAPMNYGPMNLLHLEKTGYRASMIGFPYDDIDTWRGPYPEDVLENQFRLVTEGWKLGLKTLAEAASGVQENERADFAELQTIAEATYCHLRSTYLQVRFVIARNHGFDRAVMADCIREEITLAQKLHEIVRRDSRIGFEASNHYYYSLNDLREKVISCEHILSELA
ncbi:MAG: hypothetical protein J5858_00730 [Lentisphaeria bacterium]|nr:hypothetical protein [Lentisphaeria bacterium]